MPFHIRLFLTLPLALITLLVLSNRPASAEWVQIDKTDEGVTTYFNTDTIRRKGDLVKMWALYDYKTAQINKGGNSYLSVMQQNECDCAEERIRLLAAVQHSDNMGRGKAVWSSTDERKWAPVPPGSIGEALWNFACGKQ